MSMYKEKAPHMRGFFFIPDDQESWNYASRPEYTFQENLAKGA